MSRNFFTVLFLAVGLLRAAMAFAQSADPAEAAAIRDIIAAQIAAFRAEDAETAFGFAAPSLQRKFGTAETFMTMVREGYQPVYRPSDFAFRDLVATPRGLEQRLYVRDASGIGYLAHYLMERQADGTWRIAACYLERLGDQSV